MEWKYSIGLKFKDGVEAEENLNGFEIEITGEGFTEEDRQKLMRLIDGINKQGLSLMAGGISLALKKQ